MPDDLCRCRVCGYLLDEPPWGPDGSLASFDICPCCGVEFGYEDCTAESTLAYRKEWSGRGAKWFDPSKRPENWDVREQIKFAP